MNVIQIDDFFFYNSHLCWPLENPITNLLVVWILQKEGKLKERADTSPIEDLKFVFDNFKLPFVDASRLPWTLPTQDAENMYKNFKAKLIESEKDNSSYTTDTEILLNYVFNRYREQILFYYFNEQVATKTLVKWIEEKTKVGVCYCPFNSILNAEDALIGENITVDAPIGLDPSEYQTKNLIHILMGNYKKISTTINRYEDPLYDKQKKYELGFSCLPFIKKTEFSNRSLDQEYVEDMYEKVKGRFVAIVSLNFGIGSLQLDKKLREKVLSSGRLKAVLSLPTGFLAGTSVYTIALAFDEDGIKHNKISFLDLKEKEYIEEGRVGRKFTPLNQHAQSEIEKVLNDDPETSAIKVSLSDVASQDYNLDIGRYKAAIASAKALEGISTVALEDVAKIYRAQSSQSDGCGDCYYEVSVSDINTYGIVETPKKEVSLLPSNKALRNIVRKGDVILAIKGSTGKVGLVENAQDNWLAGQSFVIIRLKDSMWTPEFLFRQLNSKRVRAQLEMLSTGGVVKLLKISDVKSIKLIPPTAESLIKVEKAKERRNEIISKIKELQTELESLDEIS